MNMIKVVVPLAQGFEEIEAVCVIDVLRRGGLDVILATLDHEYVKGAHGITIKSDCHIQSIQEADIRMIVLPGGGEGTRALTENSFVQNLLKEMDKKGKDIAAICAAPIALDKAGVLKEGYTCYPGSQEKIKTGGYSDTENIVQTENIMTSRGPGTAICFGIAIVGRLLGQEKAASLKEHLLAEYC